MREHDDLRAYGRALAEGAPPLTQEQVTAAARVYALAAPAPETAAA